MNTHEIRWTQRFSNFKRAFSQLKDAIELSMHRPLSKLEEQGLIQAFEFTHELAWNTLKDFLENHGVTDLYGSKDVTREAFRGGLITDGETWMDMIKNRNLTTHTYDETTASAIVKAIIESYYSEFGILDAKLEELKAREPL